MTRLIAALVAATAGIALLLAGLAIDAWLHARDATLVEREGIFTLGNPGHLLLALGLALAMGGIFVALHAAWGMARAPGLLARRSTRHVALAWSIVVSVAAVAFALSVSASGHAHAGDALAAHSHAAADEPAPAVVAVGAAADDAHAHDEAVRDGGDGPPPVPGEASDPAAHTHAAAPAGAADVTADAPVHTHAAGDAAAYHHAGRPAPTADELACRADLTARSKAATLRFTDISVALAEGFRPPVDAGGTHYSNPAYMRDGTTLDLANPESLVYVTGDDGGQRLAGALYRAPVRAGPTPCGAATYWHTHSHCVDDANGRRLDVMGETCPAGATSVAGRVEMMHLWFLPRGQRR